MKVTAPGLIRSTGVAAIAAGLLFVVIQPIHPPDTLASVTTGAWSAIHQATLLMTVLFLAGITGIYASQVEESGWLGLAGYVALSLGLLITAGFVFVEAFIEPLLTGSSPAFVESVLAMVEGTPTQVDLGPLPNLWSASGALFLGGCIVFGIATIRARVLSRAAAAVFAFGFLASAPISIGLDAPRLTAVPIGLGLAWLGYVLWSKERTPAASRQAMPTAQSEQTTAA
jgi:hypothetical protein